MTRRMLSASLLLSACYTPMPPEVLAGDARFDEGQYGTATEHYVQALEGYLTPTERASTSDRLLEAADLHARDRLAGVLKAYADQPRFDRVKALYGAWQEHQRVAGTQTDASRKIEALIEEEVAAAWPAIDERLKEQDFAQAAAEARRWTLHTPPSSAYRPRYTDVLAQAATHYQSLATDAQEPARALYLQLAAVYGAQPDVTASEALERIRAVRFAYTVEGPACASMPETQANSELTLNAVVKQCTTREEVTSADEPYSWVAPERRMFALPRCREDQDQLTTCDTSFEARDVDVEHSGIREVTTKRTTHTLQGTLGSAPAGARPRTVPFSFTTTFDDTSHHTRHGSKKLTGQGAEAATAGAREELEALVERQFASSLRQAKASAALVRARERATAGQDAEADAAFAQAAILGQPSEAWMRSRGLTAEAITRAIAQEPEAAPGPAPSLRPEPALELAKVRALDLMSVDAAASRGFPAATVGAGPYARVLSTGEPRSNRSEVGVQLSATVAPLATLQRHGWGFAFEDRATATVHLGLGLAGAATGNDTRGSGARGALASYEATLGYRTNHLGARAGVRVVAGTYKIGELITTDLALPFLLRLEARKNERYPLTLELYGFSQIQDPGVFGGTVSVPHRLGYFALQVDRSTPNVLLGNNWATTVPIGRHSAITTTLTAGGSF